MDQGSPARLRRGTEDAEIGVPNSAEFGQRVGSEIKLLRRLRKITLARLSAATTLSTGYLSQIERGISTPSIKALHDISAALGVSIGWFFSDTDPGPAEERDYVVRKDHRRRISHGGGISDYLLTPSLKSDLEVLLSTFSPGSSSGDEPYTHVGEEAGVVLSGALEIWIGDRFFRLSEGDSFNFKSTIPHRYRNPGDIDAVVVWVVTPPTY